MSSRALLLSVGLLLASACGSEEEGAPVTAPDGSTGAPDSGLGIVPPVPGQDAAPGLNDAAPPVPMPDGGPPFPTDDAGVPPVDGAPPVPVPTDGGFAPVSPELQMRYCTALCGYYERCYGGGSCSCMLDSTPVDIGAVTAQAECYERTTTCTPGSLDPCWFPMGMPPVPTYDAGVPPTPSADAGFPGGPSPIAGCEAKLTECGNRFPRATCEDLSYWEDSARISECLARSCREVEDCIYGPSGY